MNTKSFESEYHKGNNESRAWSYVSDISGWRWQAAGNYVVTVSVDNPSPSPGETVKFTIGTYRDDAFPKDTYITAPPVDLEVAIEMADSLSVSGTPTFASGRSGNKTVPDSVSYSNGVFNVGTLKGPDVNNAAEQIYNSVTLPVEVDSNAVVNGQCLTATLTGNPPPGTGPHDDDISDNVVKFCLSEAGTVAGTQEEPFTSGQVEDAFNINIYPCVGVTDLPCDSTDDVRVRAIAEVGGTKAFLGQGTALMQIPDRPNREYDSSGNSVNSGETVSWQIPLVWDAGELDAVNTQWSNVRDAFTASGVTGGTPPGKAHVRAFEGQSIEIIYKMTSATGWSGVDTVGYNPGANNGPFEYIAEFEKLGTYKIGFTVKLTRDTRDGDEDCDPDGSNVNQRFCASDTYTFHVGPIAELEVRDGGGASLPPGQRAFSIVAVNHGPDAAPAARVTVTGLAQSATVNYTASRGSFDFDSEAGAWVWDIGELLSREAMGRYGRDGETLTIVTGAASQVTAAIENTQDYSVCIDSSAADVELASPSETACTTEDATNSWHSTVYYDYDDGNDEAVIRQVTGSGEAQVATALVSRDQTVVSVSWPDISTLNRRPVIHYEVARSNDGGNNWRVLSDRWPVTTYFDAGASAGPGARYRVRTVNDLGHKGIWSAGVGSGQSARAPGQPQNVTGTHPAPAPSSCPGSRPRATGARPSPATGCRRRPPALEAGATSAPPTPRSEPASTPVWASAPSASTGWPPATSTAGGRGRTRPRWVPPSSTCRTPRAA